MATNTFKEDPLKLVIYDPLNNKNLYTKIFINAPKNVLGAINSRNNAVLKGYFGADYKRKLGLEAPAGGPSNLFLPQTDEEYIGGDFDTSDIEKLLLEDSEPKSADEGLVDVLPETKKRQISRKDMIADVAKSHIEYISDIKIYPEDKFSELKDKIYLATGIPPYRQHLFYIERGRINIMYKLYAVGLYQVDIRNIKNTADEILGVPIDKFIYDNREDVKIEALENFQLIGDHLHSRIIYCVDLAQFTSKLMTQLNDLVKDTYRVELFYYGFILKYWPQLTQECFHDYIIDERELMYKYPDLSPARSALMQRYVAERDIIDYNYTYAARAFNMAESIGINIAVAQMTAMVNAPRTLINIRNLFDKLRVTRCIPEIHAYVEHNGKQYMLRKRHIKNTSDIPFPAGNLLKSGITISISLHKKDQESYHARSSISTIENEQSRYLFLNIQPNGRYYIKSIWNEEDELSFEQVIKILKKFTDPIINGINALGRYVFIEGSGLPLVTKYNIDYQSLNICIFWKKVMLENTFKIIKTLWEPYLRAKITSPRNVQQFDKYEFTFCKGMHDFDRGLIESIITASHNIVLSNHYSHLSNNSIKQKWNQNYEGRIVRMSHRTTDVRFEILSIRESEFTIFYRFIVLFIYKAQHDPKVIASLGTTRSYKDVKKLRKLREQDPELYNIKKYGSDKTYSIKCQKKRQPLIYTPDEIKSMPQSEVKKLNLYWNFTLNQPAYYGCPNKENPHLTFLVGIHPKHYCLPCCGQTPISTDSKKARISSICMSKHKYIIGDVHDAAVRRHILSYGKDIDQGRISKIPTVAKELLFNTLTDSKYNYYIYGVPQHFPAVNYVGVIYSAAEALEMTTNELVLGLISAIKVQPELVFNTALNGTLREYFHTVDDFVMTLKELFIDNRLISREYQRFTQWQELFVELLHMLMDVNIFILIDNTGEGEDVNIYINDILASEMKHELRLGIESTSKYIILIKKVNKYYPIFILDADRYSKTFEVARRTYLRDDNIIELVYQMVTHQSSVEAVTVNKRHNLTTISEFINASSGKYSLTTKYINRQNLCYATLIGANDAHLYIPVDYSIYIPDGVVATFNAPKSGEETTSLKILLEFIDEFNKFILVRYKVSGDLCTYERLALETYIRCNGAFIGAKINGLIYYCNISDTDVAATKAPIIDIKHDYREINKLILERKVPAEDNRTRLLGESLYNNYKYQLLVLEFIAYLERERNIEIRSKLNNLITTTNFKKDMGKFIRTLRDILKAYNGDFSLIQKQLSDYYYNHLSKNQLLEDISTTVYEFDHITLNKLRSMNISEVKSELKDICSNFVVEKEFNTAGIKFPNIYLPCSGTPGDAPQYCSAGKLMLNTPLDEYIDILSSDIKDDLRVRYLLSGIFANTTLSYLQFTIVPTEIITIYRLLE
jgi:hypothetical protein